MNPLFHNWIPLPNNSTWSLIVQTMSQWQNKCSDSGWMGSICHLLNQKTSKVIDNDNIIDNIDSVIDKGLLRLAMLITPAAPNWVGGKRVPPRDWWWECCPGQVVWRSRRLLRRISCSRSTWLVPCHTAICLTWQLDLATRPHSNLLLRTYCNMSSGHHRHPQVCCRPHTRGINAIWHWQSTFGI